MSAIDSLPRDLDKHSAGVTTINSERGSMWINGADESV
jgi:hypothetical protein